MIITDKPCVLINREGVFEKAPLLEVSEESCSGCRACLKIGCPAIEWRLKVLAAKKGRPISIRCLCRADGDRQRERSRVAGRDRAGVGRRDDLARVTHGPAGAGAAHVGEPGRQRVAHCDRAAAGHAARVADDQRAAAPLAPTLNAAV